MRIPGAAAALLALGLGAACEGEGTIHRSYNVNNDGSLAIDAAQRLMINNRRFNDATTLRVVCTEPSPDVATTIAKSFSASLSGAVRSGATDANAAAAIARSFAQQLVQLGERTTAIQLLRDALFRACEAYSNNAIDKTAYAQLLSRFDTLAATLVTAELGAGAVGRMLAGISTSAGPGGEPSEADRKPLTDARALLETARGEELTAELAVNDAKAKKSKVLDGGNPDAIATANEELQKAELNLRTRQGVRAGRQAQVNAAEAALAARAGRLGGTAQTGGGTGVLGNAPHHVTTAMLAFQRQYFAHIQNDYSPLISTCIGSLDSDEVVATNVVAARPVLGAQPTQTTTITRSTANSAFKAICNRFLSTFTDPTILKQFGMTRLATSLAGNCVAYPTERERTVCQQQVSILLQRLVR